MKFETKRLFVGGIYPFKLGVGFTAEGDNFFRSQAGEAKRQREYRRTFFGPELQLQLIIDVLSFQIIAEELQLSNHRKLHNLALTGAIFVYESGFCSMIIWLDCGSSLIFSAGEVVELTALVRGTSEERIVKSQNPSLVIRNGDVLHSFSNLLEVFRYSKSLFLASSSTLWEERQDLEFCFPLVSLGDLQSCQTMSEARSSYANEIAGILNLWIDNYDLMKEKEVARAWDTDFHPFEYGITLVSSNCALEAHPSMHDEIARRRTLDRRKQHHRERAFFAQICEFAVLELYIIRTFDVDFTELQKLFGKLQINARRLVNIFGLLRDAIALSSKQNRLLSDVAFFRIPYFARKSYILRGVGILRSQFGTDLLYSSLDSKLNALKGTTETIYSMLTTVFVLILTMLGTLFTFLSVYYSGID